MFSEFNHVTLWTLSRRCLNAANPTDKEPSQMGLALQTRTAVGWNDNRQTPVDFHQPEGRLHELTVREANCMAGFCTLLVRTGQGAVEKGRIADDGKGHLPD